MTFCLTNNTLIPFTLKELGHTLTELNNISSIKIITGEDIESGVISLA